MKISDLVLSLALFAAFVPGTASAKPDVKINMSAEKEIVVMENGRSVTKRLPADQVEPGQVLIFTLSFNNIGDETAAAVNVNNPIPEDAAYIPASATGNGADITFSVDGGKTYGKPELLTHDVTLADGRVERRKAKPAQYTHIRWVVGEIPPGSAGQLGFSVKVK